MKNTLVLITLLIGLASCNTDPKNTETDKSSPEKEAVTDKATESEGYQLMVQKCYICHFETPNPEKRDQMIAPPMVRVQEHYKPSFSNKEEFIEAVMAIVKNPSEEHTLMPGTIKKFNLMPKLPYDDAELRLIAEALYDHEFGSFQKGRGQMQGGMRKGRGSLQLNEGKKWDLKDESMEQMATVVKKINDFESIKIEDYNQLGKDVFHEAKLVMLDKTYTGDLFDQIHVFFNGMEDNMHILMSTKSMDEAEEELSKIKKKFKEFYDFFE